MEKPWVHTLHIPILFQSAYIPTIHLYIQNKKCTETETDPGCDWKFHRIIPTEQTRFQSGHSISKIERVIKHDLLQSRIVVYNFSNRPSNPDHFFGVFLL